MRGVDARGDEAAAGATRGPATSASCATRSSARCCWPKATRSTADDFPVGGAGAVRLGDRVELPAAGIDLEQLERSLVVQALERTGWNQTRAAALLGLTAIRFATGSRSSSSRRPTSSQLTVRGFSIREIPACGIVPSRRGIIRGRRPRHMPPKTRKPRRNTVALAGWHSRLPYWRCRGMSMVSKERVESGARTGPAVPAGRRRRHRAGRGQRQLRRRPADRDVRRLSERAHDAVSSASRSALREEIPEFETLRLVLRCSHD